MQYNADKKLIDQVLAGDEKAFRCFFDEHVHRIYRFALTRVNGDSEAAKDIAQQTLTKALKNLPRYRGEAQLFSWLCAICRNEAIDWIRRNNKHMEHMVLVEDNPDVRDIVASLQADPRHSPDYQHAQTQRSRLIQVAMDQLPQHYGDALEWKYAEGYSVLEIAEKLGLSKEATHSLIARAKRAFADVYSTLKDAPQSDANAGTLL